MTHAVTAGLAASTVLFTGYPLPPARGIPTGKDRPPSSPAPRRLFKRLWLSSIARVCFEGA